MKKISDLLFKNILWKILSVLLAIILWFICINVVNPVLSKTYAGRLEIRNLDVVESNNYVLLNQKELEEQAINMTVKAVSDLLPQISSMNLRPYIDLSPIEYLSGDTLGKNQSVNVYVEGLGPASMVSQANITANPITVNIRLDKIETVNKAVTVNIIGEPQDTYEAYTRSTEPETIKITGASTILNRISVVSVEVDVTGATKDVYMKLAPEIIDIDKKDITSQVILNLDSVEAVVLINKRAKIPVEIQTVGAVEDGYVITSVQKSTDYIEVLGSEADINALGKITIPDLNVVGWSRSNEQTFDAREFLLGTSLSIVNGTPNEITVTVNIERQIKKEIFIGSDAIRVEGLADGKTAVIQYKDAEGVAVTVKGLSEKISAFTASDVQDVFVNVAELDNGYHSVSLSVVLPQGVYEDENMPTVEVLIADEEVEAAFDEDLSEDENL